MGRTNYVILALGLATCVMLSLLMKHALKIRNERDEPAIVSELTKNFGSRLVDASQFRVQKRPQGRIGVVTIHPLIGLNRSRLVESVGHFVWQSIGDEQKLDALVVVCDTGFDDARRYQVRSPRTPGRPVVLLQDGEEPTLSPLRVAPRTAPQRAPDAKSGVDGETEQPGVEKPAKPPAEPPAEPPADPSKPPSKTSGR